MSDYKCYMRRIDIAGQPEMDLEKNFKGLIYKEFIGLDSYGKIKSVYTEEFAETDELQVYQNPTPIRENTDLTFTCIFTGNDRRNVYHSFVDFISKGKIQYWDNIRNRKVTFILIEAIEPSDDKLYGSTPYIIASFKLKNIKGQTDALEI